MTIRQIFAYLCVGDAAAAIAFHCDAFGATLEPSNRTRSRA